MNSANVSHDMKHAKLHKIIIILFPMYCDAQPPPKKPKMDPRQKIAPKLNCFEQVYQNSVKGLDTHPRNVHSGDLNFIVISML